MNYKTAYQTLMKKEAGKAAVFNFESKHKELLENMQSHPQHSKMSGSKRGSNVFKLNSKQGIPVNYNIYVSQHSNPKSKNQSNRHRMSQVPQADLPVLKEGKGRNTVTPSRVDEKKYHSDLNPSKMKDLKKLDREGTFLIVYKCRHPKSSSV